MRVLSPKEKAKEEAKMEYKKMRDVQKKEFNELAFKNEITACETHQSTSKFRKKQHIDLMMHVIDNWDDVNVSQKYQSVGHNWVKTFTTVEREINGKKVQRLQRITSGKVVVSEEDVFDIIYETHDYISHKGVGPTNNFIKQIYDSIPEKLIKLFVKKICPVCMVGKERKKKVKGARNPILSKLFRMRYQADLIDFRSDPRVDHNGNEMKWLLVVKDHFTKFTWLRPIKKKEAPYVRAELIKLYTEWGFPMIHHTDNGNELFADIVQEILDQHPMVCSVTGQPRKPQEQGSVERQNREIKKILSKAALSEKLQGVLDPSWIDLLPKVTIALNCTTSYGNNGITPYRHVFNVDYDCPVIDIEPSDRKQVKTVTDLAAYCEENEKMKSFLKEQGYDIDKVLQSKNQTVTHISFDETSDFDKDDDCSVILQSKNDSFTHFSFDETSDCNKDEDCSLLGM